MIIILMEKAILRDKESELSHLNEEVPLSLGGRFS